MPNNAGTHPFRPSARPVYLAKSSISTRRTLINPQTSLPLRCKVIPSLANNTVSGFIAPARTAGRCVEKRNFHGFVIAFLANGRRSLPDLFAVLPRRRKAAK